MTYPNITLYPDPEASHIGIKKWKRLSKKVRQRIAHYRRMKIPFALVENEPMRFQANPLPKPSVQLPLEGNRVPWPDVPITTRHTRELCPPST